MNNARPIINPSALHAEQQRAILIQLVERELQSAGYSQHITDPVGQAELPGYHLFELFADASRMRDGIIVLEHIPTCDETLRYSDTCTTTTAC